MISHEDLHMLAEVKLEISSLRVKESQLRHQLHIVACALEAFQAYPRDVRVPLAAQQSESVGKVVGAVKGWLPTKLSIAASAAEQLAKLAHIKVAILPILEKLRSDLKSDIARVASERKKLKQELAKLEERRDE